jgi:hypothetical protein
LLSANSVMTQVMKILMTDIVAMSVNIEATSVEKSSVRGKSELVFRLTAPVRGKSSSVFRLRASVRGKCRAVFRLSTVVSGVSVLK